MDNSQITLNIIFVNSLENLNAPTAKQFNQNTFHSENDNRVEFHDNKITADAAENNGDEKEKRPCRDKILELIRKMCDEEKLQDAASKTITNIAEAAIELLDELLKGDAEGHIMCDDEIVRRLVKAALEKAKESEK